MSKFFSRKILMLCVLALAGCDLMFIVFFFEESAVSKKLKEIGVGEYKYLEEIYNGQWEKVCVLLPYYEGVIGLSDKEKEAFIDKKIAQSGLVVSEALWHLLFFRNAHDDDYFDYISFIAGEELDAMQQHHNFSQKKIDDFNKAGFSPAYCAERNQAVMFKSKDKWKGHTFIYITLGVIDQ